MRHITLALLVSLCVASSALAQQAPPTPPTPPPPPATASAPTPPVAPAPAVRQTVRPVQAPRTPAPPQTTAPAPRVAEAPSTGQNIRLDVMITDSITGDAQNKKTVTMLIVDGRSGMVRSASERGVINIDARPMIRPDGRIYLQIAVEYRPQLNSEQVKQMATSVQTSFNESLSLVVSDGKSILASQSADPSGDRRVTLELLATIIK